MRVCDVRVTLAFPVQTRSTGQ